jgi:hypothetical protein
MKRIWTLQNAIFALACLSFLFAGCGGTYQGKWVSYPVDRTPKDEFKAGADYVVLAIEYPTEGDAEATLYRFLLFQKGEKTGEISCAPRVVSGMRRFYLSGFYNGKSNTLAQYSTKPDYETVKLKLGEELGGLQEEK